MIRWRARAFLLLLAGIAVLVIPRNIGQRRDASAPLLSAAEAAIDPSPYRAAAVAVRAGDFDQARRHVESFGTAEPGRADETRIILGLYAARYGRPELATRLLARPEGCSKTTGCTR